jgi:1,4-alpha-glucan branching enzyme/maltooligosyltrehalose trehalohydrolase
MPRLHGTGGHAARFEVLAPKRLKVEWRLGDGSTLRLLANLGATPLHAAAPAGATLFAMAAEAGGDGTLALGPWAVVWTLEGGEGQA